MSHFECEERIPKKVPTLFCRTHSVSRSQPPPLTPSLNFCSVPGWDNTWHRMRIVSTTVVECRLPCRKSSSQSNPRTRCISSQALQITRYLSNKLPTRKPFLFESSVPPTLSKGCQNQYERKSFWNTKGLSINAAVWFHFFLVHQWTSGYFLTLRLHRYTAEWSFASEHIEEVSSILKWFVSFWSSETLPHLLNVDGPWRWVCRQQFQQHFQ